MNVQPRVTEITGEKKIKECNVPVPVVKTVRRRYRDNAQGD